MDETRCFEIPAVVPRAVLDAGDARGKTLTEALLCCLESLGPGQVLEVISQHLQVEADIALWCGATGHELVTSAAEAGTRRLWLRKGEVSEEAHFIA